MVATCVCTSCCRTVVVVVVVVVVVQLLFCCCVQSDEVLVREMAAFRQASFQYVCMMQDIHAQKQYELMEPVSWAACGLDPALSLWCTQSWSVVVYHCSPS